MTGEELYGMYEGAMSERGIGLDSWENLTREQQRAWDRLGARLAVIA